MGKQLVGRDTVEQHICHEERKLYVDQTMILSPGAKDYLTENGVAIVYGARVETCSSPTRPSQEVPEQEMNKMIAKILKRDYGIEDDSQICEIIGRVLARLKGRD